MKVGDAQQRSRCLNLFLGFLISCGGATGVGETSSSSSSLENTQGGTGITRSVSSPSEMSVGDIMPVTFDDTTSASIDFSSADSAAEYILIVGSSKTGGYASTMQVASADTFAPLTELEKSLSHEEEEEAEWGSDEVFHAWLRGVESELALTEQSIAWSSTSKSMVTKSVKVGDVESFRVLASLSSASNYVTVEAELACLGDLVGVYIDTRVTEQMLTSADIESLCTDYDDVAAREIALIGEPSDVNGDGRVAVLLTPQINRLGSLGGGIITGYFYARDLYKQNLSTVSKAAGDLSKSTGVSNEREIIYMMVPDPQGTYGVTVSRALALNNLLPAVFPHELKHAISYNQHVFVHGGAPEVPSIEESGAHFLEDLMGHGMENASRFDLFLSSPSSTTLVGSSSPNLMERGAGYLFLRFLYEQSADGNVFMKRLIQSGKTGVANIQEAFQGSDDFDQFSEFFGRWTVALAMTNRGLTTDSRYVYEPRSYNAQTESWEGVCLICDPDDGRGTVLDGVYLSAFTSAGSLATLQPSAAKFYEITSAPSAITLEGSEEDGHFAVLIRTK